MLKPSYPDEFMLTFGDLWGTSKTECEEEQQKFNNREGSGWAEVVVKVKNS